VSRKKKAGEKIGRHVHFKMTDDQYAELEALSEKTHVPVSEIIRHAVAAVIKNNAKTEGLK
jgi:predicted DNA-binding protein